jgi:tetratricopeptide (TPR) repeat protein
VEVIMFRNKIVWLAMLAILPMSLPAQASDTQQEKKILTDRANYWDRQGRGDMAVQVWEQLLLVDPDNVQALAGLARYQAKSAPELGVEPESGASGTVASADSDAAVQTQAVAQPHEPVRKVEDWADLYPDGLKAHPDGTDAGQGSAPQGNDISSGQAAADQAVDMKAELTVDSGSQSPEAKAADAGNQVEAALPHPAQPEAAEPAVIVEPQTGKIANDVVDPPAVQSDTGVIPAATSQSDSTPVAMPQEQPDTQGMMARAQYWEKTGRSDMAAQAWQQLLLVDPDNVQAQAGLARYQTHSEPNIEQPTLANSDNLESGKTERDIPASAETAVAAVSETAQHATLEPAVEVQPEGDGRKVEEWANLYQSGLKEGAPTAGVPLPADDQTLTPDASPIAINGRAEQVVEQRISVPHPAQPELAEPAVIVDPQTDKIANDVADTPAVQSDTGVIPAAASQPDSTPVAIPQEQPDTQGMMARAQYWEKTGRSDMAAQAWQQLLLVDPDNVQAQAGLDRNQTPSEPNIEQPTLANSDKLESGKTTQDIPASAEAAVAAVPETAQHATLEPAVEIQPEGEGRKVEDWADLYQSGLKESVPTAGAPLPADDQTSTPIASQIAINGRAEQAIEQPVSVEPRAANAMGAAVPDVRTRVETGRAPGVTLRAPYESAPPEKWPEFYQRGIKPAQPESETDSTPGGSLLVSDKPSRQELLDQAQYWDSRGRADLSAKIRKELAPQPEVAVSGKPDAMNPEVADKPKFTVSSKPEIQAVSVAAKPAITTAENRQVVSQPQVTLDENVQALVAQPSRQELHDRVQYWEERGRSDLAAKVPDQPALVVTEQGNAVPGKNSAAGKRIALAEKVIARSASASQAQLSESEPGMALAGAAPSKQELEEQAAYWEARGRSDLASKARPTVAGAGRDAAIASVDRNILAVDSRTQRISGVPEHGRTALSREELDEQAQYWEARGRGDLADQLRNKLYTLEPVRPASLSKRAAPLQAAARDDVDARSALENSLLKNPGSMAARLDLAKIYQSAGEMAKARLQIDSVLAVYPDLPDALYASAQLYAAQRLWWETLHTLDKISPVSRTAEMGKLQKMAWAHVQIDRADALVRQGNNAEAELLLRQVAAELAVNYNQTRQPEPPPLWKSTAPKSKKARR